MKILDQLRAILGLTPKHSLSDEYKDKLFRVTRCHPSEYRSFEYYDNFILPLCDWGRKLRIPDSEQAILLNKSFENVDYAVNTPHELFKQYLREYMEGENI